MEDKNSPYKMPAEKPYAAQTPFLLLPQSFCCDFGRVMVLSAHGVKMWIMGSVCLSIPHTMLLEKAHLACREESRVCPSLGGSRAAQGKIFAGCSPWQDTASVENMAGNVWSRPESGFWSANTGHWEVTGQ